MLLETDFLGRRVYEPRMLNGGQWKTNEIFYFESSSIAAGSHPAESVDWVKHLTEQGLHELGKQVAASKVASGKMVNYWGFLQTKKQEICGIEGLFNERFVVVAEPNEGEHHFHIELHATDESTRASKRLVREQLTELFLAYKIECPKL